MIFMEEEGDKIYAIKTNTFDSDIMRVWYF